VIPVDKKQSEIVHPALMKSVSLPPRRVAVHVVIAVPTAVPLAMTSTSMQFVFM
jgi:hypothetical protein